MPAQKVLDREFLELRAKILELAASLDRMDRGEGDHRADPRMALIGQGLSILSTEVSDRAERVQMLFSRAYNSSWKRDFRL
jgi:hypothetical protein